MASLVFGTRTADTKNDSVINVSAISEALYQLRGCWTFDWGFWNGFNRHSGGVVAPRSLHRERCSRIESPPGNGSEVPRG